MSEVNLNSLKSLMTFKVLYENETATKTAKVLGMTQSGVSRSLALLEQNLGMTLFLRKHNRLVKTREAKELYEDILRLKANLINLEQSATALKEFGVSRVNIASVAGLGFGFVPKLIAELIAANPKSEINFSMPSIHDMLSSVVSEEIDIGFVLLPVEKSQLMMMPLFKVHAVCMLPASHPLVEKPSIDIKDLNDESLVMIKESDMPHDRFVELVNQHNVKFSAKTEASISSLYGLVAENVGVSVINSITASDMSGDGSVVLRPFTPTITCEFGMIYRQNWKDSKVIEFIKHHLPELPDF